MRRAALLPLLASCLPDAASITDRWDDDIGVGPDQWTPRAASRSSRPPDLPRSYLLNGP